MTTESPWTFATESSTVGAGAITLVEGTTFLVCAPTGDIGHDRTDGLFMIDTRVLSSWRLRLNGRPVEGLTVSTDGPMSATFVGRVHDPRHVDAPVTVIQRRHVGNGLRDDLEIRNYATEDVTMSIEIVLASDFASVFDVKSGSAAGPASGVAVHGEGARIAAPDGPTGQGVESTVVTCDPPPGRIDDGRLEWDVTVPAGDSWHACLLIGVTAGGTLVEPSYRCGEPVERATPMSRLGTWREEVSTIGSDWPVLTSAFEQAAEDLGALRIFDPVHPDRLVVAAGAPWFMTLFGRDSLLTSWMALPLDHALARGVLRELADAQGRRDDPTTEEQPGKILHEVRFDAASSRLLGGTNTYYGTVDATPLFVMLVAELARWTGVTDTIRELLPAVDRAMAWITDHGDRDGDGFVDYLRSDPSGLANQGWKDSWDGVRHRDGSVARGPIALCEVQGYVYAAYRGRAALSRALGEPASVTTALDDRADELRAAFDRAFWVEDGGWYAIGLDGDHRRIESLASNIGHLLWTGIVPDDRAAILATHLAGPRMFTGWGVRTLAADAAGYNPLSYHCGSVWPHDSAIAVAGLARYGFDAEAQRIAEGLIAASAHSGGRLPELFAGFGRDDLPAPVPYPASCSPQAWAAAAPLLLVRAMLGLEPDLPAGRIRVRPRLGPMVHRLALVDVPLGTHRISISATHDHAEVTDLPPGVSVEIDLP